VATGIYLAISLIVSYSINLYNTRVLRIVAR
jgi:ABC-type amino acid transport system permease subunit